MLESSADLVRLQNLLDESHRKAGAQLQRIFNSARASAPDVIAQLPGIFEIHLATLAASGAPLVAPVDALFIKGRVWFSLSGQSVRAKLVARDNRISASYTDGEFGLIVHGTAQTFTEDDPDFAEVDAHVAAVYVAQYGEVWLQWRDHALREYGRGYSAWIDPRVMFAKRGNA